MTLTFRSTALIAALAVAACAPADIPSGINDPFEADNRTAHQFNTELDKALIRPTSNAYGSGIPRPIRRGVGNFASNVDLPRSVVNNVLQARVDDAVVNTFRFIINTTVGIAGLFDPATSIGLAARPSDFGETLHVWGVSEGPYQELPIVGPSTHRDTAGMAVDLFLNPLSYVIPSPERYGTVVARGLARVGDRYTYGTTVDSVLYDSADSYAQARVLYLENRRYQLQRLSRAGDVSDDYFDPYAEGEAAAAPVPDYYDPYEDQQ